MLQDEHDMLKSSQATTLIMEYSNSGNMFAPKISIKLQENNFFLWNEQVEGVILSHKLHKIMVNPYIPSIFKIDSEILSNIISEEYESWIVQDKTIFALLLSTISESVIPRALSRKHAYEAWDKVNKHFHSQMKARVHHLRAELKTIKVANPFQNMLFEFELLQIHYLPLEIQSLIEINLMTYFRVYPKNITHSSWWFMEKWNLQTSMRLKP